MPTIQPIRNEALFGPDRLDRSIKMMAMIGTGLMATPTASGSESPIACPMIALWGHYVEGRDRNHPQSARSWSVASSPSRVPSPPRR